MKEKNKNMETKQECPECNFPAPMFELNKNGGMCEGCAAEIDALREMGLEEAEFYSPNIGCK